MNSENRRESRQREAAERQALRDVRSDEDQLILIQTRGASLECKEAKRLIARIKRESKR